MDGFQTTILGVAVVILILVLAGVGIIMAKNKSNLLFPPSSLPCPNYWQQSSDGKCIIPNSVGGGNDVNLGSFSTTTAANTPGYDSVHGNIDFNNNGWGSTGVTATCAKQKWTADNKILWDGVSNYNGCA